MDFIASPPEVTSALIHAGPGADSLVEAAHAWQRLGTDLEETVRAYVPALATAADAWNGPSSAVMIQAVAPYLDWLRGAAQQCQQLSAAAQLAVAAFGSTVSTVVYPAEVSANRLQLAQLLATNGFGRNLAAIAETEAQYQNMWVSNSAAMYRYEAASAQALELPEFFSPPSIVSPTGSAAQASVVSAAAVAPAATVSPLDSVLQALGATFDPNAGWFGLTNTYLNQFVSSGFPINLLSYLAQNTSAQALTSVAPDIAEGLSEGESALGASAATLSGAARAVGAADAPTAAVGVGVSMGNLKAPPAAVGVLTAAQSPVQLASAATPLAPDEAVLPMLPPLMPPPISAGSGWRKRKPQKYEDLEYGLELKGTFMPRPPSAG
ncbi:putative PPE family protein PPE29 [Mycobacterium basiliense]|uniref:Putative PPE family protein PPE29 n=1 Tax=Mycobacterium basiliense TaxID=2094119 RepID=A0A447GAU8_9MYCO|nr:PPE family protein [Mycobacterium basiliense]VDM87587.1 putative PPE family protein PPE29 [Mycobacterium basiliense]